MEALLCCGRSGAIRIFPTTIGATDAMSELRIRKRECGKCTQGVAEVELAESTRSDPKNQRYCGIITYCTRTAREV